MDDTATACPQCGTPNVADVVMDAAGTSSGRASFGHRLLAVLIDGILVGVIGSVVQLVLGDIGSLVSFVGGLAYYIYLEGSPSGQTVGKKVMSIRVVTEAGGPLGYGAATGRYFARILSAIPCGLGYFWMLWDDKKQTWHDKLVHTTVVTTESHPVAAWPG